MAGEYTSDSPVLVIPVTKPQRGGPSSAAAHWRRPLDPTKAVSLAGIAASTPTCNPEREPIHLGIYWRFDQTQAIGRGPKVADYVSQHAFTRCTTSISRIFQPAIRLKAAPAGRWPAPLSGASFISPQQPARLLRADKPTLTVRFRNPIGCGILTSIQKPAQLAPDFRLLLDTRFGRADQWSCLAPEQPLNGPSLEHQKAFSRWRRNTDGNRTGAGLRARRAGRLALSRRRRTLSLRHVTTAFGRSPLKRNRAADFLTRYRHTYSRTLLFVLHITGHKSIAVAFALRTMYSEKVGIDIGFESEWIQPNRGLPLAFDRAPLDQPRSQTSKA